MCFFTRTLEEIRLEVDIEDVAAETLNRVIERQNMHPFTVFDIKALMDIDKVAELHSQVVARNLVNLDATLLNIIGAQAD